MIINMNIYKNFQQREDLGQIYKRAMIWKWTKDKLKKRQEIIMNKLRYEWSFTSLDWFPI